MKKGVLFALLTAFFFVTLEPVTKLIANDVTPYAITFWRFIIGGVILLPFAISKIKKNNIKVNLKDFGMMALWGIIFICISMIALQVSIKKADSPAVISIIFSANSIFTIIFAAFILKEKVTKNKVIALVLGVIGVLICADFSKGTNMTSIALAVFSAVSFSLYTVVSRKYVAKYGSGVQACIVFFSGSFVLLIALLILGIDVTPTMNTGVLLKLGYTGICVTGMGYMCYFMAIEKGGAIMASLSYFIKPILTPFVTWAINDITPNVNVFIAVILIVGASYFATLKKKEEK